MPLVAVLRKYLLAVICFGIVGTGTELLLLGHYDGYWQLTPVVLLGVGQLAICWHLFDRRPRPLRSLRAIMILFLIAGVIGLVQHFSGNAAFEQEMTPEIGGVDLIVESLTGATPALAPGAMIQLGLLGLLYIFRHPGLVAAGTEHPQPLE